MRATKCNLVLAVAALFGPLMCSAPPVDAQAWNRLTPAGLGPTDPTFDSPSFVKDSTTTLTGNQTLSFIENKGQFDSRVKFRVTNREQTLWLTENGIVFDFLRNKPAQPKSSRPEEQQPSRAKPAIAGMVNNHRIGQPALPEMERHVVYQHFIGAKRMPTVETKNVQPGTYNYFLGSDPTKWRTDVRAFGEIVYKDVWDGVDVKLYGNPNVEQEFVVQPGADPTKIQVAYRGVDALEVSEDGSLLIKTVFGELRESKPVIYQEIAGGRVAVDGRFKLTNDNGYMFDVGTYSTEYPLVIDPTLLYSTFLGGSSTNTIVGMTVDTSGSTYVAGVTASQDFPITSGTLQAGFNIFVTKLNASGSALVYSSILGRGFPVGFFSSGWGGIALDNQGNAYVAGFGFNIATTANAFSSCSGFDGFLAVLAPAGNQLVYSTCLHSAAPAGLAVDSSGRAFLAGQTGCGLATTSNAFQPNCPSGNSGFLRVFDTTFSGPASLVYSSYLGDPTQSLNTFVGGIALDSFGKVYITGQVYSSTSSSGQFPTTPGAFRTTLAPCTPTPSGQNQSYCQWPYIAKFDTTAQGANSLIYSTYIGYVGQTTMTADGIPFTMPLNMGIAVDGSGNAYITGGAGSTYPTTPGAYQTTGSGTFVTKLNASGSNLVYSTLLPTNTYPNGSGTPLYTSPFNLFPPVIGFPLAVGALGQVYISGNTTATNYPVTPDAFQSRLADSSILGGGGDAFLTILNSAGSGLVYSSYLGGGGAEQGKAVALDQIGDVYIAGQTKSLDFPVTASAYQPSIKGTSSNLFASKFPLSTNQTLSVSSITPVSGGNAGTVTPQILGTGFHAGMTAQLNCPSPIVGTNLAVGPAGRVINATFNLVGVSPGICDIVVTNLGGASVTLAGAFTVQQGGAPNIQIYLTGLERRKVPPEVALGPADALIAATISNTGNVDSSVTLVSLPVNLPFTPTSAAPTSIDDASTLQATSEVQWLLPIPAGASQIVMATTSSPAQSTSPVSVQATVDQNVQFYAECVAHKGADLSAAFCPLLGGGHQIQTVCEQAFALACVEGGDLKDCNKALSACYKLLNTCTPKGEDIIKKQCDCTQNGPQSAVAAGFSAQAQPSSATGCTSTATTLPIVIPTDPNDLVGPPGVGGQRWMAGAQGQTYVISFSNIPTAPVPAQQVIVTLPLGSNVNLSSLRLLDVTIPNGPNNVQSSVPAGAFDPSLGVNEFITNVDLRPSQNLLVAVDTKLDPTAQTLTWTFTSIDPATGLPPFNPLVGFLPPGSEANVSFSVTPTPGLPTGSQVIEEATIVFVGNSPMSTQIWLTTIDNSAPISQVPALPSTEPPTGFTLSWSGTDAGAGIQDFTIYVSDNGGPFMPFQTNTTATSATFTGQIGHNYSFYSIARDLVGNVETSKTTAEAITQVALITDSTPPTTTASVTPGPNPAGWNNSVVTINLTSVDNPDGLGLKQLGYAASGAQPVSATTVASATASFTVSTDGITTITYFGTDNAENVETTNTLTIRLDKAPPIITGSRNPAPNANGWNNTAVTASFQCVDALSGLAAGSPPAQTLLSSEGANQSVSGNCLDLAGNSASATVSGINIDKTPPILTVAANPPANANGWNNTNVTVSFIALDSLSGVATVSTPVTVTSEGAGQMVSGGAIDLAGNSVSGSASISLDKTPPEVFTQFDPVKRDVVLFGRDALSGVAPGPVQPISVVILGRGDDDGDDMGCPDTDDVRKELRTYQVFDLAGNVLQLVEKVKSNRHHVSAKFVSLQYGQNPTQALPRNRQNFEFEVAKDGSLKELEQEFRAGPGEEAQRVEADFDGKTNQTIILQAEPKSKVKTTKQGLDLLRIATSNGKLLIEF